MDGADEPPDQPTPLHDVVQERWPGKAIETVMQPRGLSWTRDSTFHMPCYPRHFAWPHPSANPWLSELPPVKIRALSSLLALLAGSLFARAASTTNQWFAGLHAPPRVIPALPANFIVVSASPEARTTKLPDMYAGEFWAPERTARRYEFGAEPDFSKAQDPMFYVRLSGDVAQYPGRDTFTHEKTIESDFAKIGVKKISITTLKWGDYPLFCVTGERSSGSLMQVAWLGLNSPDGWTVLIDYRMPRGAGRPNKEDLEIWQTLIRDTKPAK